MSSPSLYTANYTAKRYLILLHPVQASDKDSRGEILAKSRPFHNDKIIPQKIPAVKAYFFAGR
jgi:hypothetical protein